MDGHTDTGHHVVILFHSCSALYCVKSDVKLTNCSLFNFHLKAYSNNFGTFSKLTYEHDIRGS